MQLYDSELEHQVEFHHFDDFVRSFKLLRGKRTFDVLDAQKRYAGTFKVRLYHE